jgi:hypothetical protein
MVSGTESPDGPGDTHQYNLNFWYPGLSERMYG